MGTSDDVVGASGERVWGLARAVLPDAEAREVTLEVLATLTRRDERSSEQARRRAVRAVRSRCRETDLPVPDAAGLDALWTRPAGESPSATRVADGAVVSYPGDRTAFAPETTEVGWEDEHTLLFTVPPVGAGAPVTLRWDVDSGRVERLPTTVVSVLPER